jgi:hypothetical protein
MGSGRSVLEQELGIIFVRRPRRAALPVLHVRGEERRQFVGVGEFELGDNDFGHDRQGPRPKAAGQVPGAHGEQSGNISPQLLRPVVATMPKLNHDPALTEPLS